MAHLPEITQDNYEKEVPASAVPVILDFGAEWCQPCKKLAPIMESLAHRYAGKIKIGYVDVGHSPRLASQFRVMSVPTLLFLRAGQVVKQVGGTRSEEELSAAIDELLGKA